MEPAICSSMANRSQQRIRISKTKGAECRKDRCSNQKAMMGSQKLPIQEQQDMRTMTHISLV
uniref:Uncharacterized protein n=1 Tax=Parascaris equorum TaxID=6256 RepID=A0A914S1H7_PAREQ